MNEFGRYHPIVNFLYYAVTISFSVVFMHPICLMISFLSGFSYSLIIGGKGALKFNLCAVVPLMAVTALLNPAFNHAGVTIAAYFPNGNPLTVESIAYGAAAAFMTASVICHFSGFNKIMTSDKLMYLFSRIIPSLSLVFSMSLRFVPRFFSQIAEASAAQRAIGLQDGKKGIKKLRSAFRVFMAVLMCALENAVDTADSMKSRGFGTGRRTAFSNFTMSKRDAAAIAYMLLLTGYIVRGAMMRGFYFKYFPEISEIKHTALFYSMAAAYALLFFVPHITEAREAIRWKSLRSKI